MGISREVWSVGVGMYTRWLLLGFVRILLGASWIEEFQSQELDGRMDGWTIGWMGGNGFVARYPIVFFSFH